MEKKLFVIVILLFFTGTVTYHWLENWSWIDALYFSVTTLTTIGYGDLYPTTNASKLFTVFYVSGGISIVLYVIAHSYKYIMRLEKKIENLSRKILRDR